MSKYPNRALLISRQGLQRKHTVQLSRCFERTRICAWLRVGDYLYLRVTRESLASDSRVTRKLCANLRDHLANAQNHLSNARRESDMRDLYNLNNLARKVCCKIKFHVEFSSPPDVNMYVKFDCIDYCLVPPSIHT